MLSINFMTSLERNVPPSHSSFHLILILQVLGVGVGWGEWAETW